MTRRLVALASVLVVGVACSGSDDSGPLLDDVDGGVVSGGVEDVDELQSVFPLPSGDVSVVSAYREVDGAARSTATATFAVVGPAAGSVVDYYDSLLTAMGYLVSDPIVDGESLAIEITDPANDAMTATIEAGPDAGRDGTIRLYQERIELVG